MKKRILSMLLAAIMVLAIVPFSAITAFAAGESITVSSIEIEALMPADGVEAKIDAIRIKSVNGDASLANQVSFRADKLFWAEVPNLDPSTWGSNWSKFTGTFEEGKIYRMNFTASVESDKGDGDVPVNEDDIDQLGRCLDITVTVDDWNVILVTPEF